jgi:hypothetical protein
LLGVHPLPIDPVAPSIAYLFCRRRRSPGTRLDFARDTIPRKEIRGILPKINRLTPDFDGLREAFKKTQGGCFRHPSLTFHLIRGLPSADRVQQSIRYLLPKKAGRNIELASQRRDRNDLPWVTFDVLDNKFEAASDTVQGARIPIQKANSVFERFAWAFQRHSVTRYLS